VETGRATAVVTVVVVPPLDVQASEVAFTVYTQRTVYCLQ
jgi:hypothetical protein